MLNADDDLVVAMAGRTAAQVVTFGGPTDGPAPDVAVSEVTTDELGRQSFEMAHRGSGATVHLAQVGAYQWRNAAAAAAMALAAGLDLDTVADSLADAGPASRRQSDGLNLVRGSSSSSSRRSLQLNGPQEGRIGDDYTNRCSQPLTALAAAGKSNLL